MADISPFCGIRYNLQKIHRLQEVIAPPYDIISKDEQEDLYQRHPANIVRLELGKQEPGDNEQSNRYTRAAADLHRWEDESILIREKQPAFYLYRMEYTDRGGVFRSLTTMFCRMRLAPFSSGTILPHEATLTGPKEDRLHLLRATRANLSTVFSLFSDPQCEFERLCAEPTALSPLDTVTDAWGTRHRLWVVTDPAFAAAVREHLNDKTLFIADGHHRYETMLRYQAEMHAAHGDQPGPWDWGLMVLANMDSQGITVLPTHRAVRNVAADRLATLLDRARELFNVSAADSLEALQASMQAEQAAGRHAFGIYLPGTGFRLLRLEKEAAADALLDAKRTPAWRRLDVALL
ncbi:MAG TPA: DUF1015 domain-containing protein, partial [Armatimonadota bacterium]|nr:DUF1015 domain-containing protein [Armatimonadota bacterium]